MADVLYVLLAQGFV